MSAPAGTKIDVSEKGGQFSLHIANHSILAGSCALPSPQQEATVPSFSPSTMFHCSIQKCSLPHHLHHSLLLRNE
ncbi:hypothetical protein JHK82_029407 [Glycine max]|nr:hypothetical protein JHK82_029407 [Glycine max]